MMPMGGLANEKTCVENQSLIAYLATVLGMRLPKDVCACLKPPLRYPSYTWNTGAFLPMLKRL